MSQLSSVLVVIVFLQVDDGSQAAATTTVTPLDSTSHRALPKAVVLPNISDKTKTWKWPSVLPIAGSGCSFVLKSHLYPYLWGASVFSPASASMDIRTEGEMNRENERSVKLVVHSGYSVLQFRLHNKFLARSLTNVDGASRQPRLSEFRRLIPNPVDPKKVLQARGKWNQYSVPTLTWLGGGGGHRSTGAGSAFSRQSSSGSGSCQIGSNTG